MVLCPFIWKCSQNNLFLKSIFTAILCVTDHCFVVTKQHRMLHPSHMVMVLALRPVQRKHQYRLSARVVTLRIT